MLTHDAWADVLERWETTTGREQRRAQGSFWTPADLAGWMAEWCAPEGASRVLDPAAGAGALLAPFASCAPTAELTACETDPLLREVLGRRYLGARIERSFFELPLEQRFDAISANPPYLQARLIPDRDRIMERLETMGFQPPAGTNLAVLFLLAAWNHLAEGGRMIFLMPTEIMQTRGASWAREFLASERAACQIVDLEDTGLFGPGVISTACLVAAARPSTTRGITFSRHAGRAPFPSWEAQAASGHEVPYEALRPEARWRPRREDTLSGAGTRGGVALGEIARVFSGVITGKNGYFIRSYQELEQAGIADTGRYVLIRPHQLPDPMFHGPEVIDAARASGQRRFVMSIGPDPNEMERAELDRGEAQGIHTGPTQSSRSPWWAQEGRAGADLAVANFRRTEYLVTSHWEDGAAVPMPFWLVPNGVVLAPALSHLRETLVAWLISSEGQKALTADERHAGSGLYTLRAGALRRTLIAPIHRAPADWRLEMEAALRAMRAGADDASRAAARAELDRTARYMPAPTGAGAVS